MGKDCKFWVMVQDAQVRYVSRRSLIQLVGSCVCLAIDHCDRLMDSLQELPDSDLSDSLLRFFFECCENVHIQPCWWESLPKPAQEMLINHMDVLSDFGPADCARDFFSDDGLDYGTWPIKRGYVVQ